MTDEEYDRPLCADRHLDSRFGYDTASALKDAEARITDN